MYFGLYLKLFWHLLPIRDFFFPLFPRNGNPSELQPKSHTTSLFSKQDLAYPNPEAVPTFLKWTLLKVLVRLNAVILTLGVRLR